VIKPGAAILAGAVIVSAAAVAVAGRAADPLDVPDRAASEVATTKAALACPESSQGRTTKTSLFAVSPATDANASPAPSSVSASTLDADAAEALGEVDQPGKVLESPLADDAAPAAVVTADGPLSAGVAAAQWSTETGKSHSGAAASWCLAGADDWWFNGISTQVGATSRVVLTNSTPAIAVADLTFYGPDGVVEAVGERGIALAPSSRRSIALSGFAPGLDAVTVNVHATTGRVTAAVHTTLTTGVTPGGTEWIPPSSAPAEEVLVDAGLPDADAQTLQITNPGEREALVKVQVVDASGAFTPSGLDDLRVAPGTVVTKDLTDVTDEDAAAIVLSSTVPLTGAVVSTATRPNDLAVSVASPVLAEPAVVPVIPGADLAVAFASSIRTGGQVDIEGFDRDGTSVSQEMLNLKGLTTKTWKPPGKIKAAYFVITVVVDGSTHAVAQYSGESGITALPVMPGTYTVTRPDVRAVR
jgi:hypothetical protein